MKRTLWNITLASLITLVVYILLYAFWGAVLNSIKSFDLQLLFVPLMTTVLYSIVLLYVNKMRNSVGENEVLADYSDERYTSFANDFKLAFNHEKNTLIFIFIIIITCFALNTIDNFVFGEKIISFLTIFYAPMCLFSTLFNISFIGYVLNAILICIFYMIAVIFYRKRKYYYWMTNKE